MPNGPEAPGPSPKETGAREITPEQRQEFISQLSNEGKGTWKAIEKTGKPEVVKAFLDTGHENPTEKDLEIIDTMMGIQKEPAFPPEEDKHAIIETHYGSGRFAGWERITNRDPKTKNPVTIRYQKKSLD